MIILATLVAFRRKRAALGLPPSPIRTPAVPALPIATILALIGILLAAFEADLSIAWKAGVPFLIGLSIAYAIVSRRRPLGADAPTLLEVESR